MGCADYELALLKEVLMLDHKDKTCIFGTVISMTGTHDAP